MQGDLAIEVFGRKRPEILDLLAMVRLELGHGSVEHGFTACRDLFVFL